MKKYAWMGLWITLGACSMVEDTNEAGTLETQEQAILNGVALTNNHKIDLPGCSGTALDNRWVLTAGHCLSSFRDNSFDADGKLYITNAQGAINVPTGSHREARALGVDSQNRTVVAVYDSSRVMRVVRLLESGALDTSFGTSGVLTYSALQTTPEDLIISDAGTIYVLATSKYLGVERMTVFKIRDDGTLDTSFSGDGVRIPVFNSANSERAASIDLDSQGRIVVGGTLHTSGGSKYGLFRLLPSSSIDTAFDGDGKVIVEFASSSSNVADEIGIDPYDDTIYMIGTSRPSAGYRVALMRLRANGSLHTQLDYDGKAYLSFANRESFPGGISVDATSGDVIVGAAVTLSGSTREFGAQRIKWSQTAGTALNLHSPFGSKIYPRRSNWNAITMSDVSRVGHGTNTFGAAVVLAGSTIVGGRHQHAFAKINPNTGALEGEVRGVSQHAFKYSSASQDMPYQVVTLPDGRFVTTGRALHTATSKYEAVVTRHTADFLRVDWAAGDYLVKVGGTTTSVSADRGFAHPTADVGLWRLATPLSIGGSTTGHWESMSTRSASSIQGETIRCYGYGGNSLNGALLDLRVHTVNSTPTLVSQAIQSNAGMCGGDSGSGCYDQNGSLVSVHVSGNTANQGCTTTSANSVPTQNFRSWALSVMSNN